MDWFLLSSRQPLMATNAGTIQWPVPVPGQAGFPLSPLGWPPVWLIATGQAQRAVLPG